MEAKLVTLARSEDRARGVTLFTAKIECHRCREHFPFSFHEGKAEIHARYMAEEIAMSYISRAAPPLCPKCI